MKKTILFTIALFHFLVPFRMFADEGMWLPLLLQRNAADMQKKGMRITTEDIYSVNNASLKDAVLLFGNGCTAEFISAQGLILTNHHCGFGEIVSHSTVKNDYLTNGFWAMQQNEELPCQGLSVTRLVYMQDVTTAILQGVTDQMSEQERQTLIQKHIQQVTKETETGTHYNVRIEPFYYGNQYFMYVNEVFTDVRLVGAPPSNIGKFGGDTDNWMWPRHTGDFSMFRVYANAENKPTPYSQNNRPYTPKKHLTISLKGYQEGDFTFVFGYPGTTQQFLTSDAVHETVDVSDPARIKLRDQRLSAYNKAMNQSAAQRLRYASRVASIANGWKKWQGEILGIKRMNGVERKKNLEQQFQKWANETPERQASYGGLLSAFKQQYLTKQDHTLAYLYLSEALLASDILSRIRHYDQLIAMSLASQNPDSVQIAVKKLQEEAHDYFGNDYANHRAVDKEIFSKTIRIFYDDFGKRYYPHLSQQVQTQFGGDIVAYAEYVYEHSFLTSEKATHKLLKNYKSKDVKRLLNDPAFALFLPINEHVIMCDIPALQACGKSLDSLYRQYVRGIMEMDTIRNFYPDANLTLRVTYGNIKPFFPSDGVKYATHTTLSGIMQKENPEIYDYVVEQRLKDLYMIKDYGNYGNADSTLNVCFIASNHTTGGNSGSPVLNADGELIGINFDRNWEGTMSDLIYDPNRCRNISLDIRYCLFLIDKFAGAHHLIKEMTISQ